MSFWKKLFGVKESQRAEIAKTRSTQPSSVSDSLPSRIYEATLVGDPDVVKALLKRHHELVFSKHGKGYYTGSTPLHVAASEGRKGVVELLLANKAEVNATDDHGNTPLHRAMTYGNVAIAELLLANNAGVNARANGGNTPLHEAAHHGDEDLAGFLLINGAQVNAKNNFGWTPLHYAASTGNKNVAELLLANGADVNYKNDSGDTPLDKAYLPLAHIIETAELLHQHGGKHSVKNVTITYPWPFDAVAEGDLDKVKVLLEANPDLVFGKDNYGLTALHFAAMGGHRELVELLLVNKAEVNAKGNHGQTPLHYARDREVVELLLANKAEVNAQNDQGETPLANAAEAGRKDVIELLLTNKAIVNTTGSRNHTPLHWAAVRGHKDIVELLLANNAEVNAKDKDGDTALRMAEFAGHKEVAELLRHHGASETYSCPECGAPVPEKMRERGIEVGLRDALAIYDCSNCSKAVQIPLREITKWGGVKVVCGSCRCISRVPASVWCKTCGVGLSTGWQKTVS